MAAGGSAVLVSLVMLTMAGADLSGDCRIAKMQRIGTVGAGLDWHPTDDNQIAIARLDSSGTHQLHIIHADGSEIRCLTCQQSGGAPKVDRHKGVPHWHPSGDFLFFQAEQDGHKGNRAMSQPGSGRNNDIWATTPNGSRWWQLTSGRSNRDSGTLFPVPSNSGDKLAWAERYAGPRRPFEALRRMAKGDPPPDIWGRWRIVIADLRIQGDRISLENNRNMTPGNADFYEMQVWGKDDKSLFFAASINRKSPYVLDIWRYDLANERLTALTDTGDHWEEHISFSRSFSKGVMMSSECCRWNSGDLRTLQAELYLTDSSGEGKVQLTKFNTPGSPEYDRSVRSVVAKGVWSPDGRRVAFARILISESNVDKRPTDLWMLTFSGPCGR